NCKLMDSFAIFIQSLLGIVAISTLFLKRQHEVPQRPFLIWFFDVSKQASGSAMVHGLNLFAAYFSGKSSHEDSNPCIWYFMNLVLDTTFGVYILYLYLKLINVIVQRLGIENMDSGDYGSPPRPINWVKQSIAFFMALLSMKVTVMIALALFPFLAIVGRMFLAPFQHLGDPRIQIVMVMLVVPLVMNIIQFWLIDHVIK
ncbi:Vaculolar membrane protein-domain-containing protein, partial [Dimargaris cristalligena]